MEINYEIKNNTLTINSLLQNELKVSSRLLYKLIKLNKIKLNHHHVTHEKQVISEIL